MTDLSQAIFNNPQAARKHLEALRWPDGPVCPHCGAIDDIAKIKDKKRLNRPLKHERQEGLYYCNHCDGKFTVTVGTVIERSHVPLHKWVLAFHLMAASKKGMSAHQLHRMLGVTYKTAWFMAHRIREAMAPGKPGPMGGKGKIVEADETYMGKRSRRNRRKGGDKSTFISGHGWVSPIPLYGTRKIVALVERGGEARSFVVDRVDSKTVQNILFRNADRQSRLMTDEAAIYIRPGYQYAEHHSVNHSAEEWARGSAHTNSIEGYFSIFKRGMKGVYQHCGEQHLHRYLSEFDFRYSNRKALGVDDAERAARAIQGAEGKRLTYRRTNEAAHA